MSESRDTVRAAMKQSLEKLAAMPQQSMAKKKPPTAASSVPRQNRPAPKPAPDVNKYLGL